MCLCTLLFLYLPHTNPLYSLFQVNSLPFEFWLSLSLGTLKLTLFSCTSKSLSTVFPFRIQTLFQLRKGCSLQTSFPPPTNYINSMLLLMKSSQKLFLFTVSNSSPPILLCWVNS